MNKTQFTLIQMDEFFQRMESLLEEKLAVFSQTKQAESDTVPELLSRKQAAEFLGVSLGTIDNLSRAGILQKHFIGSVPRFKKKELLAANESWQKYQR